MKNLAYLAEMLLLHIVTIDAVGATLAVARWKTSEFAGRANPNGIAFRTGDRKGRPYEEKMTAGETLRSLLRITSEPCSGNPAV